MDLRWTRTRPNHRGRWRANGRHPTIALGREERATSRGPSCRPRARPVRDGRQPWMFSVGPSSKRARTSTARGACRPSAMTCPGALSPSAGSGSERRRISPACTRSTTNGSPLSRFVGMHCVPVFGKAQGPALSGGRRQRMPSFVNARPSIAGVPSRSRSLAAALFRGIEARVSSRASSGCRSREDRGPAGSIPRFRRFAQCRQRSGSRRAPRRRRRRNLLEKPEYIALRTRD